MCGIQSVLCAAFSLCYVQSLVCVMCIQEEGQLQKQWRQQRNAVKAWANAILREAWTM